MLVVMKTDAGRAAIDNVCKAIVEMGLTPHPIPGALRTAIGITGNTGPVDPAHLRGFPGVIEVIRVTKPYKLTSREMKPEDTVVNVGGVSVGGPGVVVIAGPCSVESREQTVSAAMDLRRRGAHLLRGGAYKPRSSPYSFQGLGREGLEILVQARKESGLPVVSEALSVEDLDLIAEHVDMIQIGARNMQNFSLLRRVGQLRRPVLLKRGLAATLEEFLLAAEYILSEGNREVVLCERGIRTFSDHTRFTLDLSIVPELKRMTHLPVIVDPSHAAGRWELVNPLARAAIAAGADGVMVETHGRPQDALCDGAQALTYELFEQMMRELRAIAAAMGRELAGGA